MMMKTISIITILLILPFPLANALQQPIIADVTCLLTNVAPYYDCSEVLLIVVFDQTFPPRYNWIEDRFYAQDLNDPDIDPAYAIAYRHMPIPRDGSWDNQSYTQFFMIILGNEYNTPNLGKYDKGDMTPFEHEIKHIKCDCSWHPE